VELLRMRLVPDKDDKTEVGEMSQEWLAPDGHKGWLVHRSRVPVILFNHTATADVVYEPLSADTAIAAPEAKPATVETKP